MDQVLTETPVTKTEPHIQAVCDHLEAAAASEALPETLPELASENVPVLSELLAQQEAEKVLVASPSGDDLERYAGIAKETVDLGKPIVNDWDPEQFIVDLYEDYLTVCERNCRTDPRLDHRLKGGKRYGRNTKFEDFLKDCLESLENQQDELKAQRARGHIDQRIYANGMMLREMAVEAITKYLQKSHRERLIGV